MKTLIVLHIIHIGTIAIINTSSHFKNITDAQQLCSWLNVGKISCLRLFCFLMALFVSSFVEISKMISFVPDVIKYIGVDPSIISL